jgi:pyruvate/2-oxoglutarate dehydrogenase complex dihydrolipoamide dehydrogenase (E3) component
LPRHLLVIGAGAVGLEMAGAHRRLGADVTVVDGAAALSGQDPELAAIVLDGLRAEGMLLHERTVIRSAEQTETGIRLICENESGPFEIEGSDLLVAAGRAPNHGSLDLDAAGIRHGPKHVEVGADLRTSNRRVYAVGDAAGGLFTHQASYHARLVLQQILFRLPGRERTTIVPQVIFTAPELAQVGLTEERARETARGARTVRLDFSASDRARTDGLDRGLIKIVVGRARSGSRRRNCRPWSGGDDRSLGLRRRQPPDAQAFPDLCRTLSDALGDWKNRRAISYYSPMARNRLLRTAIRFLRNFG